MANYAVVDDGDLARHYNLPQITASETTNYQFWLQREGDSLALCQGLDETLKPFSLDFSSGKYAYRLRQTTNQREPLARACGLTKGRRPNIIDATAGLAQDGLLLAALGSKVTLLEQHPLIHALLVDALHRAEQGPEWLQKIIGNVSLVKTNAINWLEINQADVVYLDPMYPQHGHGRSAKVKKGMQLLRLLPDTDTDHRALFDSAMGAYLTRLVVKRPNWAEPLSDSPPQSCYATKTHHYDIYSNHNQAVR